MLRHSSITITSNTYTTVLPQVAFAAAEATAAIIPPEVGAKSRARFGLANDHNGQSGTGRKASRKPKPRVNETQDLESEGAPSGTRTPNPLVKSPRPDLSDGAE
ncbi:hypothetical protein F9C11_17735 [Amycolatopsis sp. VS8301801F10]|uniref:hypothetical protein n=1 Tax=Amycolatopsis sp. VS8301801F10 TaxID=2652442 RepID=UPI0038FC4DBB